MKQFYWNALEYAKRLKKAHVLTKTLSEPGSLPYSIKWLFSFWPTRGPLNDQVPWISYKAERWLRTILTRDMTVFEFGSGGSTLYFANRVKFVYSIEHHKDWHAFVENGLKQRSINNCRYLLREPMAVQGDDKQMYLSHKDAYAGYEFESYVHAIDMVEDESLDIAFIDGRARVACARESLKKIKNGGYLIIDNFDRSSYDEVNSILKYFARQDYIGLCPYTEAITQTSAWKITR